MYRFTLFTLLLALTTSVFMPGNAASGFGAVPEGASSGLASAQGNALDLIRFGDHSSESAHDFAERLSVAGIDDKEEPEYTGADGKLAGGGLGHGLTYRYIQPSPEGKVLDGKLEFTLKADPTRQNYLSIRLSGTQQGRGNLMLYGPDGDNRILNPHFGRAFSELDNGYESNGYGGGGAPFLGRYYYNTYIIPQELIHSDGTVRLTIMSTGNFSPYGSNTYTTQKENSKYIYSAATHTDPFYIPEDNLTGSVPVGRPAESKEGLSSYQHLQEQSRELLELVMSWQLYGPVYQEFKSDQNAFLEGAVVTYTPAAELAKFKGATREEWAKKVTGAAINHQNWSPMMATEIFANAFMNPEMTDYYRDEELLQRIFLLYDFFARAQDSQGAWCVPTTGQNAYSWIGADLNGSGTRGLGENWPLLSLGTDSLVQTWIQLHNDIFNSQDAALIELYTSWLDEKIDHDLNGVADTTRRAAYIEMFAKLRDYQYSPPQGDFYDPGTRAGTANQDFGFAYDANRAVELLFDSMKTSKADQPSAIDPAYHAKDSAPYLRQLTYKFGEMVDGEKWISDQGLGLEGGVSHGGWAGEYGLLLLKVVNKYAETAAGSEEVEDFLGAISQKSFETAKYFLRPAVTAEGVNVLISEMYGGSRNAANGQHIAYPIGGYTAFEAGSTGAMRILEKYVEDLRAFSETFREEIDQERTPHVYTRIIELQEILKYYKAAEERFHTGEAGQDYLPMEDGHPDFAWADPDAQAVVFKNAGDRAYITFNYRRDNWEYNNNVRIHFTTDKVERLANVVGTSKGGTYTFADSTTHPEGKEYPHVRPDGFSQVRYGKYAVAMNQSKDDAAVGQTGKVYFMNTLGITKARDLISGKVYESVNGKDITVQVQPRQTVVLEVLEETKTYEVSVKYAAGATVLKVDNIPAVLGQKLTVEAEEIDGYKLISPGSVTLHVSSDNAENVITFNYEANAAPEFRSEGVKGQEQPFEVLNLGQAEGRVEWDEQQPVAITSTGTDHFSPTFAYQEVTGDFSAHVRLDHFATTATDKEYFSLLITDSMDLKTANYVQLRHFPNNNNILLVSHRADQGEEIAGYWAGDMNNKKVPIHFRLEKNGDVIRYSFSLDEGQTYEKTSKPEISFEMADQLYVGAAMTTIHGLENTAYLSQLEIASDDKRQVPFPVGEELHLDLGAVDPDGDEMKYDLHGVPAGAELDEADNRLTWTPERPGSYMIKAEARDSYHQAAVEKLKHIVVGAAPEEQRKVKESLARIPLLRDIRVEEGDTARLTLSAEGADIHIAGDVPESAQFANGRWSWATQAGDAGVYHLVVTYTFQEVTITRIVKLTVTEAEQGIDYSKAWPLRFANLEDQQAISGREFVFNLTMMVPVDGFGLNVTALNLPEGASFINRTLRWTPGDEDANTSRTIEFKTVQPSGLVTTGSLRVHVAQGVDPAS